MKSFRILALHISDECRKDVLKILRPDSTYYFISGYRYNPTTKWLDITNNCYQLESDFFSVAENQNTVLNFTAIVGKNGDGKSSLIDMILRVLNNYSYYAGYSNHHKTLTAIDGLYCTLFFQSEEKIYSIESVGNSIILRNELAGIELSNPSISRFIYKSREYAAFDFPQFNSIFYNFSLYAFHACEYDGESQDKDKNWLRSMLDKNDKYQVPVNIVPYRLDGNIDMKNEAYLNHQRMLDFFTNVWTGPIPDSHFRPYGVSYRLANDEKLVRKVLTITNEQKTKVPEYPADLKQFWDEFYSLYITYKAFFESCFSVSRKYIDREGAFYNKTIEFLQDENTAAGTKARVIKKFSALPLVLHKRITLIVAVYEFWINSGRIEDVTDLLLKTVLFKESDSERYQCLLYLIYKTINLLDKFPDRFFNSSDAWLYDRKRVLTRALRYIESDVCAQEESLLTLKLRQSLNCINYSAYMGFSSCISDKIAGYTHFISFQKLREVASACVAQKRISFLLPPIYTTEIIISSGDDCFPISRMSSGQRQLLNLVSTLSYHLKNIDDIPSMKGWVNYPNVNVILDEIDLYFHPEYQRKIVKFLIDIFGNISYEKVRSINFIVSTHSPFVLSDIPRQNVLFLKKGIQDYSMQENTFGANIHTLLKNGFFLEGMPIGDFAKCRINSLFELLNGSKSLDNERLDLIEKEALLVSEPLLRKQLLSMVSSMRRADYRDEIDLLKKRIAELEGRMDA